MSHLPWSSEQQKQEIAEHFFQGDLATANGDFIPCDHIMSLFSLPMAVFFTSLLVVPGITIGIAAIRGPNINPDNLVQILKGFIAMDWQVQITGVVLLLLTVISYAWLLNKSISVFRSSVLGLQERQRERKTGQYRYGLLLTKDYLALRTLEPPYDQEPLILGRCEISQLRKMSSGSGGARTQSIIMELYQPNGKTYAKRFPDEDIKEIQHQLYLKLRTWLY
ncbi:MAG: hypothetical protein AAF572_27835 [Cyanobacteria bacterium P01_B01_bin.77]